MIKETERGLEVGLFVEQPKVAPQADDTSAKTEQPEKPRKGRPKKN